MFAIYKKSQGTWTRGGTMAGGALIVLLGGYWAWTHLLASVGFDLARWTGVEAFRTYHILLQGLLTVLFILVGTYITFRVSYVKPNTGDFFIATEGEMKKVSWSSKEEIIGSTQVVIFTLIFMGVLLFVVDVAFMVLFSELGVLKVFDIREMFGLTGDEAKESLGLAINYLRGL